MSANDDLSGKTTLLYWFLHTNNEGTKMSKTSPISTSGADFAHHITYGPLDFWTVRRFWVGQTNSHLWNFYAKLLLAYNIIVSKQQ